MQITLCPIDMRRIVKGLYLVGKKYFFICKKKVVSRGYLKKDINGSKLCNCVKTTALQRFLSLGIKRLYAFELFENKKFN